VIRVRKHTRQLPSGKTATVRQHERSGQPVPHDTRDDWWDYQGKPRPDGDYPQGTTFFDQDGETYAVHPDGTVWPVADPHEECGGAPQFTRETDEGTETLPVDPSVPRCAEDRGAWGGSPEGWDERESRDSFRSSPADDEDDDDGFAAYQARTEELDRRVAAGESITEILEQEHLARMKERLREIYGIETSP
jgi:hypothetical protein